MVIRERWQRAVPWFRRRGCWWFWRPTSHLLHKALENIRGLVVGYEAGHLDENAAMIEE
jgi:hypothetical protein